MNKMFASIANNYGMRSLGIHIQILKKCSIYVNVILCNCRKTQLK